MITKKQIFKGRILYRKRVTDNIIRVFNDASVDAGGNWYEEANKFAQGLAMEFKLTNLQVAGIIASLSPLKSWNENKIIARLFIQSGRCKHTRAMKSKALDIKLYNSSCEREFILTTLNGNKISNFFLNIAYPNESQAVTIDRHALSVGLNRSIRENEGKDITKKQYEFFASCYRDAAKQEGVLPNQMQAVTWVKWRELKSRKSNINVPF